MPDRPRLIQYRDREAWLLGRMKGVGASDASALYGQHFDMDPYALWAFKRGEMTRNPGFEAAMEWGHRLERPIMEKWADENGQSLDLFDDALFIHPDHPYVRFSPDGILTAGVDPVDAEAVGSARGWEDGEVPLVYQIQAQHGMAVMGAARFYFAVFVLGRARHFFDVCVERDDRFIDLHLSKCKTFWEMVESGEEPEPGETLATARALEQRYTIEDGTLVELPEDMATLHHRREELLEAKGEYNERVREIDAQLLRINNRLKAKIASAEAGTIPGVEGTYEWKTVKRRETVQAAQEYRKLTFKKAPRRRQ